MTTNHNIVRVARNFVLLTKSNVASTLLLVWTGLKTTTYDLCCTEREKGTACHEQTDTVLYSTEVQMRCTLNKYKHSSKNRGPCRSNSFVGPVTAVQGWGPRALEVLPYCCASWKAPDNSTTGAYKSRCHSYWMRETEMELFIIDAAMWIEIGVNCGKTSARTCLSVSLSLSLSLCVCVCVYVYVRLAQVVTRHQRRRSSPC